VIACNSAHDFLISKGIIPKYTLLWDAHPVMAKIIEQPHPDVTYLIASRCHPTVFERFKDCKVKVWHALGGDDIEQQLNKAGKYEPMVAGGSSSVTRATHVAGMMGYTKEMHLFGVDSCYSEGKTHVSGTVVSQNKIDLRVCGKWFVVAPWMAMQAGDVKILFPLLKGMGIRIVVHGTGLIPYVATFMDVETPDLKISQFERHIKRPIHALLALYDSLRSTPHYMEASNAGY
jgi:hypothetical protein